MYNRYVNNLLELESDKTSQSFWKYIKSRKQDTVSIGTLNNSGRIADSAKIVNEYDQEIPQSQTADNPVAP